MPKPLAVSVLSEAERWKQDRAHDALFYAELRFVQHLDLAFRSRLTALYANLDQRLPLESGSFDAALIVACRRGPGSGLRTCNGIHGRRLTIRHTRLAKSKIP